MRRGPGRVLAHAGEAYLSQQCLGSSHRGIRGGEADDKIACGAACKSANGVAKVADAVARNRDVVADNDAQRVARVVTAQRHGQAAVVELHRVRVSHGDAAEELQCCAAFGERASHRGLRVGCVIHRNHGHGRGRSEAAGICPATAVLQSSDRHDAGAGGGVITDIAVSQRVDQRVGLPIGHAAARDERYRGNRIRDADGNAAGIGRGGEGHSGQRNLGPVDRELFGRAIDQSAHGQRQLDDALIGCDLVSQSVGRAEHRRRHRVFDVVHGRSRDAECRWVVHTGDRDIAGEDRGSVQGGGPTGGMSERIQVVAVIQRDGIGARSAGGIVCSVLELNRLQDRHNLV